MEQQLKDKIKASMTEFLKTKGWPENITRDQIIALLPDTWKKLEAEGLLETLVARGFNYKQFVDIALHKKNECETLEEIAKHFRQRGR